MKHVNNTEITLTLLGTGAAGGVPLYGCFCAACIRAKQQPEFVRLPCSAMVEWGEGGAQQRLLIDAGLMDLHHRFPAGSYLGFLLTHFHVDHVQGLFHLRWGNAEPIPVWCPSDEQGCADLLKHSGCLDFRPEMQHGKSTEINGLRITPLQLNHSRPTLGYLLEYGNMRFAYLTDTDGLPNATSDILLQHSPLDLLVLDCSFAPDKPGKNHGDIATARQVYQMLKPTNFVITHISHRLDCWLMENDTPAWLTVGRDGMKYQHQTVA